jgi:hypothetical protein
MKKNNFDKLIDLVKRYQYILWALAVVFACCLAASLWIYYNLEGHPKQTYWFQVADLLMNVSQTILGTILIGGGLGGIINFIFEEQKKHEEAVETRLRRMQESRDKRRQFRRDMRNTIQKVYDEVALARVLIKSHRSARTYGEQIRALIMPGDIALQDLKRQLIELQDEAPIEHLAHLQVSLTYMAAYLKVLIEEFAQHYLDIANLQNYQDVLANRRRAVFAEVLEDLDDKPDNGDPKKAFLEQTEQLFQDHPVPDRMEVVWEAMERLDYVWDFIDDLRNEKGETSLYQNFFIDHHFHCLRILRDKDAKINEKLCRQAGFQRYLKAQERLLEKKNSDQPITKQDSLTRIIMEHGLQFDFEEMRKKD